MKPQGISVLDKKAKARRSAKGAKRSSDSLRLHGVHVRAKTGGFVSTAPRYHADSLALIEKVREGISGIVVRQVVDRIDDRKLLCRVLSVEPGNLARVYKKPQLDKQDSESVMEVTRIYDRAEAIFEDLDLAKTWMNTPVNALGGVAPREIADTIEGRRLIDAALNRIEHGELIA